MENSLKTLIKEVLTSFLNEAYVFTNDNFSFRQQLNNSKFYNYQSFSTDFDTEITESNIIMNWKVSFWLNDSGIENFIIDPEKVEGTFNIQFYDKHTDEMKQETEKRIDEYEWKFIVNEANLIKGGSLYVSDLDFNFENNTCTVNF